MMYLSFAINAFCYMFEFGYLVGFVMCKNISHRLIEMKNNMISFVENRNHKKDMNDACLFISRVAFWVISISFMYKFIAEI